MIELSFILPVYNVEAYLEECLESIITQITAECEILLIDDGSTDSSGRICDGYAGKHECVSVIHKKNGGSSSARNLGLSQAKGKYIAFIDADDRITPGCVAPILEWIRQGGADICFLDGSKFFPDGSRVPMGDCIQGEALRGKSKTEACHHLATRSKFSGSACTKLFRRAFLDRYGLQFPCDRRHGEDLSFCRDCIQKAETYDALEIPYYEYRQNREGASSEDSVDLAFRELMKFVSDSAQILTEEKKPKDEICDRLMSFAAYEYSILLWMYGKLESGEKKKAMAELRKYRWVLRFGKNRRIKVVAGALRFLGIQIVVRILDLYMELRKRKRI